MLDRPAPADAASPTAPGFGRFLRSGAIYTIGPAAGRALGLLTVPFVVAALGPDDFGRFEVLSTLGSAVASVLLLGLDLSSISLFHRRPDGRRRTVFPSALVVAGAVAVLTLVVAVAARDQLADRLFDGAGLGGVTALAGAYAAVTLVALVGRAALRAEDRSAAHSSVTTGTTLATTALLVVILVADRADLTAVMVTQVGGAVLGAVAAVVAARRLLRGPVDPGTVGALLTLGAPQFLAMSALWGGEVVHRLLVLGAAGPAAVGALGVAARLGSALSFVVIGLQAAWHPRAFAQLRAGDPDAVALDARRVAALLAAATVALALVAAPVAEVLGAGRFDDGGLLGAWLLVMVAGTGFLQLATLYTVTHERFVDAAVAQIVGVAVGLGVTGALVERHGALAGAVGLATGPWVATAVALVLGRRRDLLRLDLVPTLAPGVAGMATAIAIGSGVAWPVAAGGVVTTLAVSVRSARPWGRGGPTPR